MVSATHDGKPRIFGKLGQRVVLLDNPANIDLVVDLLNERHRAGEVLRLGVSGLDGSDLGFLQALPFLQHLGVSRCQGVSLASIESCGELRELSLLDAPAVMDVGGLTQLERLTVGQWSNGLRGLPRLSKLLRVELQKVPVQQLESLGLPASLRDLKLIETSIESLAGIESLTQLKSLTLGYAPHCGSLEGVQRISGLRRLSLSHLKNLGDYRMLEECSGLREIDITRCHAIASLDWLNALQGLRVFWLVDTDVLDKDLSPLDRHRELLWVGAQGKLHPFPSMKGIETAFREKRLALGFDSKAEAVKVGLLPEDVAPSDDDWTTVR